MSDGVKKTYDGPKPISLIGSTGSIGTQVIGLVWLKIVSALILLAAIVDLFAPNSHLLEVFYSLELQTLDIVAENPDKFKVVALAAGSNVTLLADQVFSTNPVFIEIYLMLPTWHVEGGLPGRTHYHHLEEQ